MELSYKYPPLIIDLELRRCFPFMVVPAVVKTVKLVLDQKIDFRIGMDGFQTIIWLVNSEL
jgi:hypothetical protein